MRDIPEQIVNYIKFDCNIDRSAQHEFFNCPRFNCILYAIKISNNIQYGNKIIRFNCTMKNYDNEIDKFLKFLFPYVKLRSGRHKSNYLGYSYYIDDRIKYNYYFENGKLSRKQILPRLGWYEML